MQLTVESLNHASVLVSVGELRLLSDPWFSGTAFSGGWGLYYDNPDALRTAASATHLWISHWHSDHLHEPSLRALVREAPELTVLVNESANFSVGERMQALGFRRLIPVHERSPLTLAPGVVVTRYPTAGIDNMLHVQAHGWSILNYNDCNLRTRALRGLAQRLGTIDVLLTSYNHAGKLFELRPPALEKRALWEGLCRVTGQLEARHVIPCASSHYYRSAHSLAQNASLLGFDELEERAEDDPRMVVLRVGDRVCWEGVGSEPTVERRQPALHAQPASEHDYGPSVPWETLVAAARARSRSLQRGFPGLGWLVPPLRVGVTDYGRQLLLDLRRGVSETRGPTHIAAHSKALLDWLGRPFGDDTFIAGAHFAVCSEELSTIQRWVALSLLHASRLTALDLLHYLLSDEGRRFLWCRREEILTTLAAVGFSAGQLRS